MAREKRCPFGIRARFCKYQRTYAKDALAAIEMKLVFFCVLDTAEDCPELKGIFNGGIRSLRQPRLYHT